MLVAIFLRQSRPNSMVSFFIGFDLILRLSARSFDFVELVLLPRTIPRTTPRRACSIQRIPRPYRVKNLRDRCFVYDQMVQMRTVARSKDNEEAAKILCASGRCRPMKEPTKTIPDMKRLDPSSDN